MKRDVHFLTGLLRNPAHLDELNQAADYIKTQWQGMGLKVYEQVFPFEGQTYRNLIVSFGPPNAERFVVGAHYDSLGDQPGADDNASGVAGLLEISRLLAKHQPTLNKRIDLVAYTLEEKYPDSIGSKVHAQYLMQKQIPVKGMISLEMLGYYSDKPRTQHFPVGVLNTIYPSVGNFILVAGYDTALPTMRRVQGALNRYGNVPAYKFYSPINMLGLDRSDHSNFSRFGIPAMMITDTSNFRNPNFHAKTDTMDTLDFRRIGEIVKGVYGFLVRL